MEQIGKIKLCMHLKLCEAVKLCNVDKVSYVYQESGT